MAINRRNILIGLGALVGGGGALVGTGAFTTVSAAREVSVSTAGDGSAFLSITGDGEYVTDDSSDGTLTIDLGSVGTDASSNAGSGFNQEAITTLSDVLTIGNNSAEDETITVGVSTAAPGSSPSANKNTTMLIQDSSQDSQNVALVTFTVDSQSVGSGSTTGVDVTVNTMSSDMEGFTNSSATFDTNSSDNTPRLTIVATESSS
ncbi:hypothetical protein C5B90_12745 [Haloferax sp. Atlit-12N]|uniref:hypothetical protein n=1 Tax=Haloferax sp. Atlit-12N TaxID=2077203 RepID=UPI000E25F89D|nr:hypothetical protein [Haloferax sp. Atlit-12N]RDZ63969.1 hypothetical protein C5B90_12745 [Haloferax sp. Atlit-12N]